MSENYLEEVTVNQDGSTLKFYKPTEKGRTYLNDEDTGYSIRGRGGFKHKYWQHHLRDILEEAGYAAGVEKMDIDVYAKAEDGFELAVEIVMGNNDREIDHIED